ncbi:helix-turn-helix domain-containing protein [Streptomyces sp. 11x1]|uniref:helix-turn-helix domain-containing protein n=1 Tax=Streptomyces sp. 11x1 TaxID=3038642 RepID=UPI00292FF956|nr:helix-turn-helix domain-containing protein [Streptomyces sp. 11x1]
MRYADGGGLTAVGRAKREAVRFEGAEMFERGVRPPEVARRLRVSRKSAYAWHAAWREGGSAALASKGPGGFRVSSAMPRRNDCRPSWRRGRRRTAGRRTGGGPWRGSRS